jgi:hypothetical protein
MVFGHHPCGKYTGTCVFLIWFQEVLCNPEKSGNVSWVTAGEAIPPVDTDIGDT